jgi:hypothetical protein
MAFCDPGASCPTRRVNTSAVSPSSLPPKRIAGIFCMRLMGARACDPLVIDRLSAESAQRPQVRSSPIGLRVLAAIASSPLPRRDGPGVDRPHTRAEVIGARAQAPPPRTCPGYLAALAVKIVMDQVVISGDLAAVAKHGSPPSTAGAVAAAGRLLALRHEPKGPFP